MGSTEDKAKGMGNQAAGNIKQGVGKLVGDEKMQADGADQETKGNIQKATGDAKAAIKDTVNKTANAINKKL